MKKKKIQLERSPTECRTITIYLTEEMIDKLDKQSHMEGMHRNRYVMLALDHYWECEDR